MDCINLVKRHFFPALKRAGLRRVRFHDLRHTYAALLIDQGEHPKYIQGQMGHSSIKVTMDTYGHLMEQTNPEASKRLDETLFGKNGDQMETKRHFEG
jgi:integrase